MAGLPIDLRTTYQTAVSGSVAESRLPDSFQSSTFQTTAPWYGGSNQVLRAQIDSKGRVIDASNVTVLNASIVTVGTLPSTVLSNIGTAGTYGSATEVPIITTDSKGRVTGVTLTTLDAAAVTQGGFSNIRTMTISNISASNVTVTGTVTLSNASINSNALVASGASAGSYGSATAIPTFSVNTQGLITNISTTAVSIPPTSGFIVSGSSTVTNCNVGIGTANPSNVLDVNGIANFRSNVNIAGATTISTGDLTLSTGNLVVSGGYLSLSSNYVSGTGLQVALAQNPTLTGKVILQDRTVMSNASIGSSYTGTPTPTNGLIVQGNVGIGLTNPLTALDVSGTASFRSNVSVTGSTTLQTTTLSSGDLTLSTGNLIVSGGYLSLSSNYVSGTGTTVALAQNPTFSGTVIHQERTTMSKVTIGSSYTGATAPVDGLIVQGNVGIGVTVPDTALDVGANITVRGAVGIGTLGSTAYHDLSLWHTSNANGRIACRYVNFQPNNDIRMTPNGIPSTGIGYAYSSGQVGTLDISGRWGINMWTNDPQAIQMTLLTNGNVGIGATNPATLLDVNGSTTLRGTTTVTTGNLIVSTNSLCVGTTSTATSDILIVAKNTLSSRPTYIQLYANTSGNAFNIAQEADGTAYVQNTFTNGNVRYEANGTGTHQWFVNNTRYMMFQNQSLFIGNSLITSQLSSGLSGLGTINVVDSAGAFINMYNSASTRLLQIGASGNNAEYRIGVSGANHVFTSSANTYIQILGNGLTNPLNLYQQTTGTAVIENTHSGGNLTYQVNNATHGFQGGTVNIYSNPLNIVQTTATAAINISSVNSSQQVEIKLASLNNNVCAFGQNGTETYIAVGTGGSGSTKLLVNNSSGIVSIISGLSVAGGLNVTSGSKNFVIDHPIREQYSLIHGCIEGPRYDLIYRGTVKLKNGFAIIDIDKDCNTTGGMSKGTFLALTKNVNVFLQNNDGFSQLRYKLFDDELHVFAADPNCQDEIGWMVVAERKDPAIKVSPNTDESGSLIAEMHKST